MNTDQKLVFPREIASRISEQFRDYKLRRRNLTPVAKINELAANRSKARALKGKSKCN